MATSQQTLASGRAKTRLVLAHKDEFDRLYQEELNKVGLQTRKQIIEKRYKEEA